MIEYLIPFLLTCGPAVISAVAFIKLCQEYRNGSTQRSSLWTAGGAVLIAVYAALIFIRYTVKPSPDLPPWKDPEILNLGLLFLLAPIGVGLTVLAARRDASNWVVMPLVAAMVILFFVGLLAGASV